jgi:transposase-like protein
MKNQVAKNAKKKKNQAEKKWKEGILALRVKQPPQPECPRCHNDHVEDIYSAIPRWLACPNCGHMWSNRAPYGKEDRARVLQTLWPGKVPADGK